MKKFTPILLALASIAVLSFKQSNSSEKSDDFLSKNDVEILEIIQNNRKLRNSNENKTNVVLHSEEVVKNVNGITKETSLRSKIDTLMISSLNGEVILPPKK